MITPRDKSALFEQRRHHSHHLSPFGDSPFVNPSLVSHLFAVESAILDDVITCSHFQGLTTIYPCLNPDGDQLPDVTVRA